MLRAGGDKWCLLALLSPERRLCECHLSEMHPKNSEQSLPMCVRWSSDSALCPRVAWLSSNSELYPSQAHRPLKLQSLNPFGCKKSQKPAPLIFLANGFGEVTSLCVSMCAPLSLTFLCDQGSHPSASPAVCFFHKPHLHTSTFLNVASSLPLVLQVFLVSPQVNFLHIQNDLFEGQGQVLFLCCYLSTFLIGF